MVCDLWIMSHGHVSGPIKETQSNSCFKLKDAFQGGLGVDFIRIFVKT